MADWTNEINKTPRRVELEKVEREPLAISLYQINLSWRINRSIAALRKFWERPFIIVGAKFDPSKMWITLQKYKAGNSKMKCPNIYYHHQGAIDPIQDSEFKALCKRLINKPYQDFYLITFPPNAHEDDFMAWVEKQLTL